MIRPAGSGDIPELLRMGRAFHTAGHFLIPLDEETLARTFGQLIEAETGVILVVETEQGLAGAVGALLHPHYFNAEHLTGQELFWWVDPEHRGHGTELFNALEDWVREQGAGTFSMIALEAIEPQRTGIIYRRRGYHPTEHSYMRRFN